ncbi:MAG: GrpB family protein [Candidatus Babeliales bacterium]|jgi:GrpB-like predicted nucleotidyltransferase (UPF0157 family)
MTQQKWFDELVQIVPYDQQWPKLFEQEAITIKNVFAENRLVRIEHYGSTSIQGLIAKPIIDILIGLTEFSLLPEEKQALLNLGYQYIGKALRYERFFLRKIGQQNFHLALVRYDGAIWHRNIVARDYLRAHPKKASEYAQLKQQALTDGHRTVLEYAAYKEDFIEELVRKAKYWKTK